MAAKYLLLSQSQAKPEFLWIFGISFARAARSEAAPTHDEVTYSTFQLEIDHFFSAIENLDRSGVVVFNQENLSISALPEAHHMTRHLIHLTTMVTLMKLEAKSSVYNVRLPQG